MCVLMQRIVFKLFCGGKRLAVDLLSEEYSEVSERDSETFNVIPHWCMMWELTQISGGRRTLCTAHLYTAISPTGQLNGLYRYVR